MPKTYTVKDNTTNKTVTFQWDGESEPTDADIEEVFADVRAQMHQPGLATIGDQVKAKGGIQAVRVPPKFNAAPGGRGTSMDSRFVSDEFTGAASMVPFSGAEAPDNAAGRIGQAGMTAAMLTAPATRLAGAFRAAAALPTYGAKLAAISKIALQEAAPQLRYEVAKSGLEYIGVPAPIAMGIALTISGGKGKPKAPVAAAEETAAVKAVTPAPTPPAVRTGTSFTPGTMPEPPVVPRAPVAPPAAPVAPPKTIWTVGEADAPAWLMEGAKAGERRILSPQAIRQGVALAARRANVSLNATQSAAADAMVKAGALPADAVKEVAAMDAQAALLKLPGVMTPAQMNAEIAARVGNRSPRR